LFPTRRSKININEENTGKKTMELKISKKVLPYKKQGYYAVLLPRIDHIDNYHQEILVGPFLEDKDIMSAVSFIQSAIVDSYHADSEFNLLKTRLDKICDWPLDNHSENCADLGSYSIKYIDYTGKEYPVQVSDVYT
jgi:hypothetical protein